MLSPGRHLQGPGRLFHSQSRLHVATFRFRKGISEKTSRAGYRAPVATSVATAERRGDVETERAAKMGRDRARLFDQAAECYDRYRPGYPEALIDDLVATSPGPTVLDVACGTGIAARLMAQRGADVLGVDLNAGMAAIAERHGIRTEVAEFETWDPMGRSFDLVTCAQAWHWLDPVPSAVKAASVLRIGGRLCLFWSVGYHPDDVAEAMGAAYRRALPPGSTSLTVGYAVNSSSGGEPDFSAVADALRDCGRFEEPQTRSFPWRRTYTTDQWIGQLRSHSDHLALPTALQETLFDEIGATLESFGGTFDMEYSSILISARLR
jgi:SAM-dependent methyltransferase